MRDGCGEAFRDRYYIWALYIRCGIKIRNFAIMSLETVAHFTQPVSQVVIAPLINVTGRKVARQNSPKRPRSQDFLRGGAIQPGDGPNEAGSGGRDLSCLRLHFDIEILFSKTPLKLLKGVFDTLQLCDLVDLLEKEKREHFVLLFHCGRKLLCKCTYATEVRRLPPSPYGYPE